MAEYKIKDLEVLSGVKAHTIRIWEKRYSLLTPERTDTQIRLYTDEDLSFVQTWGKNFAYSKYGFPSNSVQSF